MFDSSSDADGFADVKHRLAAENSELHKENSLLKAQFEEACQVAAQFQELHRKYQQLCSELRDVKSEKEDLSHRFEICVQNNRELNRQLAEERKARPPQAPTGNEVSAMTLEKLKRENEQKLAALHEEVETLRKEKQQAEMQQKLFESKIERAIQSGGRRFQTTLGSLDDLIQALETVPQPVQVERAPVVDVNEAKLKRKMKKMRSKLAAAADEKQELEMALKGARSEAQEERAGDRKQISELENRVAELTHEVSMKEVQKQAAVMKLESRIEELKNENARLRDVPRVVSQPVESVVSSESDESDRMKELEAARNEVSAQLANISEQLRVAKEKKEKLEKALRGSEDSAAQLRVQIEKVSGEAASLKTMVQEMRSENDMLRSALDSATKISEEPKLPKPRVDVEGRVKRLKEELLEKHKEIVSLSATVSIQQRKLDSQATELRDVNYKKERLDAEVSELKSQVADYRTREEARRNSPKPLPEVSNDIFLCSDLESPLYAILCKIIANSSLHLESKIQGCFRAIVQYYVSKVEDVELELEKENERAKALAAKFNQFLVDLSIALLDTPVTLDAFLSSSGSGQKFVKAVSDLRNHCDGVKRERDTLKAVVAHLSETFEEAKCDPITTIDELKKLLEYQNCRIVKKSKQMKSLRSEMSRLAKSFAALKDEGSLRETELNAQIIDLTEQLNAASRELATLKLKNGQLEEEITEVHAAKANLEEQVRNAGDSDFFEQSQMEATEHISSLTGRLGAIKQKYKALKTKAKADQSSIARLTLLNQSLEAQLASTKDENQELNNLLKLTEKRLNSQSATEKDEIKLSYENTITQLCEQCERHRQDVQKMAESRREMEELLNATEVEYARMNKENDQMKQRVKMMTASIDRERKLIETTAAAKRIAYEHEFERRIDELRAKADADKRRICRYCAESLSQYFDPNHEINERSLHLVVDKAREDLDRLSHSELSVRRLVNAREGQATEDAVAYALMCPSLNQ